MADLWIYEWRFGMMPQTCCSLLMLSLSNNTCPQNTDNTSIYGLSIDFGPFAFMDNFDPAYTPNHDDHMLRYSYKNQPTIIWWNLVRLGESLGELIGAGPHVDEEHFKTEGVEEKDMDEIVKRAQKAMEDAGEEFKTVFLATYGSVDDAGDAMEQLMTLRQNSGSVADYSTEFIQIARRTGLSDADLLQRFKQGLSYKVKDVLVSWDHDMSTFDQYRRAAIECDNRLVQ